MIENLDILFAVTGQSLVFDCPEGRPSSIVSSEVFGATDSDDGTAQVATTGSAAIATTPDTTFDAASGDGQADANVCNLTATTGAAIGGVYLLTNAAGETEFSEVVQIVSAASVRVRNPLQNSYTTSDTFQSTRISHAIDATWVADKNNVSALNDPNPQFRWRLVYVVGVTYAQDIYFDLVRYSAGTTVKGIDVDRAFAGWLDVLPTHHREDQGAAIISEAYRMVKMDMYQAGKADQMARNRELVDDLVLHKAAQLGVQAAVYIGGQIDPAAADLANARYMERFNNFLVTPKLHFDDGNAGGSRPAKPAPIFRR